MDVDDERLLAAIPVNEWERNGIPSSDERARRRRAFDLVTSAPELFSPLEADLRISPLGPEWSHDLDAHIRSTVPASRLEEAGWLRLTGLLERVGIAGQERWAIIDGDEVIGALDMTREPAPDPVDAVLRRCAERGEVRLREVLELRALARSGCTLPDDEIVHAAAGVERALGGSELQRWSRGRTRLPPVRAPRRLRARLGAGLAALRPRVVIALSGVDGSGKSSLGQSLRAQFARAGVPCGIVWTRPGMGPRWIGALASVGKRVVGQSASPGVRAVASGDAAALPSRKGVLGWGWTMIVTFSFLRDVRSQTRRNRGVAIFDRHLLDALVTLDFVYQGVDLRLPRWLVRRFLPRAAITVYLDIPVDVAVSRKPGDTFGDFAVHRQLSAYAAELASRPDVKVFDGRRPTSAIAAEVLRSLIEAFL